MGKITYNMGKHWDKRRRFLTCFSMMIMLALMSCPVKHAIKSYIGIPVSGAAMPATARAGVSFLQDSESGRHCVQASAVKIKTTASEGETIQQLPPATFPMVNAYSLAHHAQASHFSVYFQNHYFSNANTVPGFLRNKCLLI